MWFMQRRWRSLNVTRLSGLTHLYLQYCGSHFFKRWQVSIPLGIRQILKPQNQDWIPVVEVATMDRLVTMDTGGWDSFQCFHLRQETLTASLSEICGGRVWTTGGWWKNLQCSSPTSKIIRSKTGMKLKRNYQWKYPPAEINCIAQVH